MTGVDQLQVGAGGQGVGTQDLQRSEALLQRQNNLIRLMVRGAADFGKSMAQGVQALDARLAGVESRLKRLGTVTGLGLQRAAEVSEQGFARMTSRLSLQLQRVAEGVESRFARAAEATGRRFSAALSAASRVVGAGGRVLTGAGGAIASTGQRIGSVIGGLGSGGVSGIVSSAGSLASAGIQGVAGIGAGGLSQIPVVGGFLGGALKGAAGVVGGVVELGANIGAKIVDSILDTVKVGLVAGLGLAVAAAARATKGEGIRDAFKSMVGDAPEELDRLRQAVHGTIDDIELMRQANVSLQLGSVQNVQQFGHLADAARRLGKAVGRDAGDALNDLTVGLGRQSNKILDNLGVIVSAELAYDRFALSIGKSASELSEAEKKQAFIAESFRAIDEKLQKLGPDVLTFGDKWDALKASFLNFLEQAGRPIIEVLGDMIPDLTRVGNEVGKFLAENRVAIASKLRGALEGVGTAIKQAADYLQDKGLGGAFEDLKVKAIALFEEITKRLRALFSDAKAEAKLLLVDLDEKLDFSFSRRRRENELYRKSQRQNIKLTRELEHLEIYPPAPPPQENEPGGPPPSPRAEPVTAGGGYFDYTKAYAQGIAFQALGAAILPAVSAATGGIPFPASPAPPAVTAPSPPGGQLADFGAAIRRTAGGLIGKVDADYGFRPDVLKKYGEEELAAILGRLQLLKEERDDEARARDVNKENIEDLRFLGEFLRLTERDLSRDEQNLRTSTERRQQVLSELDKTDREILKVREDMAAQERQARERIKQELERTIQALEQGFRARIGSVGGDRALPGNIRRGLARGDTLIDLQVRRELRQKYSSVSSGEIARDPDLRARIEADAVAARVGAERPLERARDRAAHERVGRAFAPEIDEAKKKAEAELAKALKDIEAAGRTAIEALEHQEKVLSDAFKSITETMGKFEESAKANAQVAEVTKKEMEAIKREIDAVNTALRALK